MSYPYTETHIQTYTGYTYRKHTLDTHTDTHTDTHKIHIQTHIQTHTRYTYRMHIQDTHRYIQLMR